MYGSGMVWQIHTVFTEISEIRDGLQARLIGCVPMGAINGHRFEINYQFIPPTVRPLDLI